MGVVAGLLVVGCLLQGCDDKSLSCPDADQDFFDRSIKDHLERNPSQNGVENYQTDGTATYDSHNNWWSVPFVSGKKKMLAILSCDGAVEFSER
ncbi:hypothetical protein [Pseudomonas sp.]|uniref:hypothetical protein n=1 Tax=Pseudomonas sp. TaxID=306 RepID=UPI002587FFFA|nr:hypothetical protein [Pseudomonas sp.]